MTRDPSALNQEQRSAALTSMSSSPVDLLVVGGGITGAGVALDAASRGLRVGLVEQRDYASGTSSRSSKLFHGGLRYLEQLNFKLVREALGERNLMLERICPHLTRPISFLYPLKHRFWERAYVGAGVALYDVLAGRSSPLPRHQHIWKRDLAKMAPAFDPATVRGAIRYWDVLVDDARHTMTVARTAAAAGAQMASSCRVVGMSARPDQVSVEVVDLESGTGLDIAARTVINATGVWTDQIQELLGDDTRDVRPSKGIHLVVPRDRIDSSVGMILRTKVSVLFLIPWDEEHWIIGTTDTPWELDLAHPAASREDIDYLLRWVNSVLTSQLTRDDIVGVYAGLRPLLTGESDQTSKLSREHAVIDEGNRVVTVAGGKYTTYRVMAADAIDALSPYLGDLPPTPTRDIPLIGAEAEPPARSATEDIDDGAQGHRLWRRYGSKIGEIGGLIKQNPELGEPIVSDAPYLRAEIAYAVTHEGALHLDDILTRRTRLSIETWDRGLGAAAETARIVAPHLGWNQEIIDRELEHYRARVAAEIDSQRQPDDHTADAARMGAADVRMGKT